MGRVLTNNTGLRVARESSVGVLPGSPKWYIVEFDTIGAFGAVVSSVVRRPISQDRGRKKGTVVDLNSAVEFDTDLTLDVWDRFCEGFLFAEYANYEFDLTHQDFKGSALNVTSTGYALGAAVSTFTTDASLPARFAAKVVYAGSGAKTLFYASGYALAGNNGVKVINADVTTSSTEITCSGLTAETAPANARLEVCGIRTDDAVLDVLSATTATLTSTDVGTAGGWTARGVLAGMFIFVGGSTDAFAVTNAPTITTARYGWARVASVSGTNSEVLNLDKISATFGAVGTSGGAETVDVLFGKWGRNVPVTAASADSKYLERTFQFEGSYPGLGSGGATEYEYAVGNFANEVTINAALGGKATSTFAFIGTNSDDITSSRKTGASSAFTPLRTTAINTSSDLPVISTSLTSSVSEVCFKTITFTILNNVSPEKCLGTLGATFVNVGLFEFNIEGQMLFTNKSIVNSIKNNDTVTFHYIMRNGNGAIALDLPEATVSGGGREFPVDASVLVNVTFQSFTSSRGYDMSASVLPIAPRIAA